MKALTSIIMLIGLLMILESYNNNILRAENCTVQDVEEVEYEKFIQQSLLEIEKREKEEKKLITTSNKKVNEKKINKKKRKDSVIKLVSSSRKVTATIYNPTREQCDSDPLVTADNSKICLKTLNSGNLRWIAVSRDLKKHYKYGSKVYLESKSNPKINGVWEVHDIMHPRYKNRIDLLMPKSVKKGKWYDVIITKVIDKKKEKEA